MRGIFTLVNLPLILHIKAQFGAPSVSAVLKFQQNPLTGSVIRVIRHLGVGKRIAGEIKISKSV